jgi:hypothetical protein
MFQDIDLSRDVMANYSTYLSSTASSLSSEPETIIQTLTTGHWPSYPSIETLVIPGHIFIPIIQRFERFYRDKYSGRRLVWAHALGRCVMIARFNHGRVKKELEVSFFQALVILCYQDWQVSSLSFEQIRLAFTSFLALFGFSDLMSA